MNRVVSRYTIVDDTLLFVEVEGNAELFVRSGEKVSRGDDLYSVDRKKILESHYLPKALGIPVSKCDEYIGRVGGEYVMEDELLAEKLASAGLVTKKLVAGVDGIVSLKRLDKGYIDILSEADRVVQKSPVDGEIVDVVLNSGIYIKTSATKVPIFDAEGFIDIENQPEVTGRLHSIVKNHEVPGPAMLDDEYEGKIVFVGQHFHRKLVTELYKKGCEAIIAYAADVDEILSLGIPVVVIKGYGRTQLDEEYYKLIEKNEGEWVKIDLREESIYLFGDRVTVAHEKRYFSPNLNVGDIVISHDIDTLGLSGKVISVDVEDEKYVVVSTNGSTSDGKNRGGILIRKSALVVAG